jgi:hypothetical protein
MDAWGKPNCNDWGEPLVESAEQVPQILGEMVDRVGEDVEVAFCGSVDGDSLDAVIHVG